MTTQIDKLITSRNRLTNRRDGLTDSKRVAAIDRRLDALSPAGQDNRVDLLLGRTCAELPKRAVWTQEKMDALADRFSKIFVEQVEALGGKSEIVETTTQRTSTDAERGAWKREAEQHGAQLAAAKVDEFAQFVDQTNDYVAHMLSIYGAEIEDTPKDWRDMRGDTAI